MFLRIKIISSFLILSLLTLEGFSQYDAEEDSIANIVLLRKQFSGGIVLHNLGIGLKFQKGKNITFFKSFLWEVQAVSMKSPKQVRIINPYFSNAKSYIYGKLNHVYIIRGGVGFNRMLNRKPAWGGVEIRYFYFGGASVGITKPIYLYVLNFTSSIYDYSIEARQYDPEKHFLDNIYGRAPFSMGLNQMRLYPGLYGKFGFDFEFGEYNSRIKALEVGGIIDVFPIGIPVMAFQDEKNFFLTLYLSFSLGRRYNRLGKGTS